MHKLVVQGGRPLSGELPVSGSKNTALMLMAAGILAEGTTTFENIPHLRDVSTFANVLRVSGAAVRFDTARKRMEIGAERIEYPEAPYELVSKMRASFYMLGALLGRCGEARVSMPGGCAWGPRPVNLHLEGLEAFGAEIDLEEGDVIAKAPSGGLPGGFFRMEPSSVGATINLMLAAVTARGTSRIENAALEPDVVVFGRCLQQMGARIEGLGTTTLEIEGVDRLSPVQFRNCPDRIELGTFMIAGALAGEPGRPFRLTNAVAEHLGDTFMEAFRQTGTRTDVGDDYVEITPPEVLAPVTIETGPYPQFPTDLQAQWTVLLSQADGTAEVIDAVYGDRFMHIPELQRMGLRASVMGNRVRVQGRPGTLRGAKVMSTDLRASVSLVLAGLVARGETHVLRVYHLDRGYEDLEGKLARCGASIRREEYQEHAEARPAAPVEG